MHDRNFEWDSEKAAANWRDHGVTFDQATKAVRDAFANRQRASASDCTDWLCHGKPPPSRAKKILGKYT
jgi:uncharacterized DUF497 family protein